MADRERRYLLLADEDLVSLAEGGDAGAFAGLYDRHSRAAYSLAYRMMGERQAAEDLVQVHSLRCGGRREATGQRGEACAPACDLRNYTTGGFRFSALLTEDGAEQVDLVKV